MQNIILVTFQSCLQCLGQVKKKYVSRSDVGQKAGKRGIFFLLAKVRSFQAVRQVKREF